MKKLITILFLFFSILGYGQTIEGVKHIEIVSEIQDTMALLNKKDIDKINQVFFEREKLDSLNRANEELINLFIPSKMPFFAKYKLSKRRYN